MTATDELLRLLDERGVECRQTEWSDAPTITWHGSDGIEYGARNGASFDGPTGRLVLYGITPEQTVAATLGPQVTGETSDGYHTFNELYHHRAVLFSVIVENYRDAAWKARKHHDGTIYDGMFIVGIDTPWGQASYHYDLDPYWDMFGDERQAICASAASHGRAA